MNIILLGGTGFIGKNLAVRLARDRENEITLFGNHDSRVSIKKYSGSHRLHFIQGEFHSQSDFDRIIENQDVVYHLISTTIPANTNRNIPEELQENIVTTANLLESCVRNGIKKVVFISSGGTVYGKSAAKTISETEPENPITAYGIQKLTIEKLLYLYWCIYGLDYRIIRLSNPYGPFQNPLANQGVVTTFLYKAMKHEKIVVYGDGSVIRDYIYIDDAVEAILRIADHESLYKLYNFGSGCGTSLCEVIETIEDTLGISLAIEYREGRPVDVSRNVLNIDRYEEQFGKVRLTPLREGIRLTAEKMRRLIQ